MQLRDYQVGAVDQLWNWFVHHPIGHPIVGMPTGTGKSLVIAGFIHKVFQTYAGQKIMVLSHVKEILKQDYEKLLQLWPHAPAGMYSAGLGRKDVDAPITFAGVGSVAKRAIEFGHVDLIIIDECHLVSNNDKTQYRRFINHISQVNPCVRVIGYTATMYRLGQGLLTDEGGLFTDVAFDMTTLENFNWLISEGYIVPLIPRSTTTKLDLDGVHMRGGEFIPKELQQAVNIEDTTRRILQEVIELAGDRQSWLIFTTGIEHAINTCDILNELGVTASVVHGGNKEYPIKAGERDKAIEDLKNGNIQALVNNEILTTGFDHPMLDLIVMLRPTASTALWVQMLGRGTRPVFADGFDLTTTEGRLTAIQYSCKQNCLVLDFAGNTKRLGPINDPVLPRKKGAKGGDAPVKVCGNEACMCMVHASARVCEYCGYEFPIRTKIFEGASTNELIKADLPVVEEFDVDTITYSEHKKQGKPDTLKVIYYCGIRMFTEYVCPEHNGYAGKRAREWWRARSSESCPASASDILTVVDAIAPATSVRVWVNKEHPEVLLHCFDGTRFGRNEATASTVQVQVDTTSKPKSGIFWGKKGAAHKATPSPFKVEPLKIEEFDVPF